MWPIDRRPWFRLSRRQNCNWFALFSAHTFLEVPCIGNINLADRCVERQLADAAGTQRADLELVDEASAEVFLLAWSLYVGEGA